MRCVSEGEAFQTAACDSKDTEVNNEILTQARLSRQQQKAKKQNTLSGDVSLSCFTSGVLQVSVSEDEE